MIPRSDTLTAVLCSLIVCKVSFRMRPQSLFKECNTLQKCRSMAKMFLCTFYCEYEKKEELLWNLCHCYKTIQETHESVTLQPQNSWDSGAETSTWETPFTCQRFRDFLTECPQSVQLKLSPLFPHDMQWFTHHWTPTHLSYIIITAVVMEDQSEYRNHSTPQIPLALYFLREEGTLKKDVLWSHHRDPPDVLDH